MNPLVKVYAVVFVLASAGVFTALLCMLRDIKMAFLWSSEKRRKERLLRRLGHFAFDLTKLREQARELGLTQTHEGLVEASLHVLREGVEKVRKETQ